MIWYRFYLGVFLAFSFLAHFSPPAQAQAILENLTSDLNIEGENTSYDPNTGLAMAKGDVRISYEDMTLRCGQASYNSSTGEIIAREDVVLGKQGNVYKGDTVMYNTVTGEITGDVIRSSTPMPYGSFFFETNHFEGQTKLRQQLQANETFVTTHDSDQPNYRFRARQITIYPDSRVVMNRVTLMIGDTPVFYLPQLSQTMNGQFNYRVNPGYQSRWGAFLLNRYDVMHGEHTQASYHVDLRSARGLGLGVDYRSMRHKNNWQNFKGLQLYFMRDSNSTESRTDENRNGVRENRFRFNLQHRIYIPGPEKSTWYVDFDINRISDDFFYEDFFFRDFRETPEPDNQLSLVRKTDNSVTTLMTRFQANSFYEVGSKLPELAVDWTRRELWNTGIFHQGNFSAGIYRNEITEQQESLANRTSDYARRVLNGAPVSGTGDADVRNILGLDPTAVLAVADYNLARFKGDALAQGTGFGRVHTYHELLYPKTLWNWLTVVPRVGAGFTHYQGIDGGFSSVGAAPNNLPQNGDGDYTRGIFHAGLDVSYKATKTWANYQNATFGIDGLRHIFQPYLNVSYLSANQLSGDFTPGTDPRAGFTQFTGVDRLSRSTRPRSLDVPMFSAIDDLRSWNITRIGVKNFLQTKRDYSYEGNGRFFSASSDAVQTYTFAGMNTYVDVFGQDPEFNRSLSNLRNELFFKPVPWINLWMDFQLPLGNDDGNFTEFNQGITFMPSDRFSISFSHQYLSDNPYAPSFPDSNLFTSRVYARLSENWGFSMNHIYEADDGTMEFQSYSFSRDLSSWIASFGAMMRDNRRGSSDLGLLFSFTLKDLPNVSLPFDIDPNPSGRGGDSSRDN